MMNWQDILSIIIPLGGMFVWFYLLIDKRFDQIDRRCDQMEAKFEVRFQKTEIEKHLNQLNTKVAVIESKIVDINTNVSYLMWQHQTPPAKEAHD